MLQTILADLGVERLYLAGLATDYCIRFTALEALQHGVAVTVLTDAVAGVNRVSGDADRALEELRRAGAQLIPVAEL